MTIAEYKAKLRRLRNDINLSKKFVGAVTSTIKEQANRIFEDGLDSKGSPIGTYSTKPIYVNTDVASPRKFDPKGKKNSGPFKNGNKRKSTYFSGGYREFKQDNGRGTKFNLFLFGNLNKAYLAGAVRPFVSETPDRVTVFFTIPANEANPQGKIDGLFKRYPQAFRFSKIEKERHLLRVQKIINKAFK